MTIKLIPSNLNSAGNFRLGALFVVPVTSLLVGLQYGLSYGVGNHNTYLLGGLKMLRPELFQNDWLVSQTTAYHPTFAYLAYLLYLLSPQGWAIALANVVTIAASMFFIYMIVAQTRHTYRDRLLLFLIVTAFLCTTETYSVSGSYIFSRTFQPSSIGAMCFLAGMVYFLKQRYFTSSLPLAIGGLFHANFLLLSIMVFAIAHIAMGRHALFKRLICNLGACLLAFVPLLPITIEAGLSPQAAVGRQIYQQINAPQHYLPLTYLSEFVPFISWLVLGAVVGAPVWRRALLTRGFMVLFATQVILVALATLLTTVVYVPAVSQMYFWRLAPFCVMFSIILAAEGWIHRLRNTRQSGHYLQVTLGIVLAAASLTGIWYFHYGWHRQLTINLLLFAAAVWVISVVSRRYHWANEKRRDILITAAAVAIGFAAVIAPLSDFERKSSLLTGLSPYEQELVDWAKDNTSVDDVFLIPPSMANFRLNAQRAVVVDTKSPPVLPSELVEWYQRLEDVSGVKEFKDKKTLEEGYKRIDWERLSTLAARYHFEYAVLYRELSFGLTDDTNIAFSNRAWIVLRIR